MVEEEKITFEDLYNRDISKYVEKLEKRYKDKKTGDWKSFYLTYLSWAYGHREMKRIDLNAKEHVHTFPLVNNGQVIEGVEVPYLQTPQGFFVQNTVTINGRSETEWLPVLDNSNNPIQNPNSFQINTSNKRCFVKALAKHGLGLYLYVGEDTPENIHEDSSTENNNQSTQPQQRQNTENQKLPPNVNEVNDRMKLLIEAIKNSGGDIKNVQKVYLQMTGLPNFDNYSKTDFVVYLEDVLKETNNNRRNNPKQQTLLEGRTTKPAGPNWGE